MRRANHHLLPNNYHLIVKTAEGNLSAGMRQMSDNPLLLNSHGDFSATWLPPFIDFAFHADESDGLRLPCREQRAP